MKLWVIFYFISLILFLYYMCKEFSNTSVIKDQALFSFIRDKQLWKGLNRWIDADRKKEKKLLEQKNNQFTQTV